MRPPPITQESIRSHPERNHPDDYVLPWLPFVTGMSPIIKATNGSLAFRAVVADTQALRTVLHNTALPVLLVQEQNRTVGF